MTSTDSGPPDVSVGQTVVGSPSGWRRISDPVLFGIGFVVVWQLVVWIGNFHPVVLPGPGLVFELLTTKADFLGKHMLNSMKTILAGFAIGGLFGWAAGVVINYFPSVRRAIHPILVSMYVVPKAIFLPIFILWWGVEPLTHKIVITTLLAFFPVTENTIAGLQGVEREMVELTQSLGGSGLFLFRKIALPFSLPFVLAGLRIGMTESFIGTLFSEVLVPNRGIGARIAEASDASNTHFIIAAIVVIALFGLASYFALLFVEKRLTKWH